MFGIPGTKIIHGLNRGIANAKADLKMEKDGFNKEQRAAVIRRNNKIRDLQFRVQRGPQLYHGWSKEGIARSDNSMRRERQNVQNAKEKLANIKDLKDVWGDNAIPTEYVSRISYGPDTIKEIGLNLEPQGAPAQASVGPTEAGFGHYTESDPRPLSQQTAPVDPYFANSPIFNRTPANSPSTRQADINLDAAPAAIAQEAYNRTQAIPISTELNQGIRDAQLREELDWIMGQMNPETTRYPEKVKAELLERDNDPEYQRFRNQNTALNYIEMADPNQRMAGERIMEGLRAGDINIDQLNTKQVGLKKGYQVLENKIAEGDALSRLAGDKVDDIFSRGSFGVVYPSDTPGYVIKAQGEKGLPGTGWEETSIGNTKPDGSKRTPGEKEVDMMEASRGLHMAPDVASLEITPGGDSRIEMKDVRDNYTSYGNFAHDLNENPALSTEDKIRKISNVELKLNQQLANFADRGYVLNDRHAGNVQVNKMSERPTNIDFGLTKEVTGDDQLGAEMEFIARGFQSAGLGDIGEIFRATIIDLNAKGLKDQAADVAQQGLQKLNEIERPLNEDMNLFSGSMNNPDKVRMGLPFMSGRLNQDPGVVNVGERW